MRVLAITLVQLAVLEVAAQVHIPVARQLVVLVHLDKEIAVVMVAMVVLMLAAVAAVLVPLVIIFLALRAVMAALELHHLFQVLL